MNLVFFYILKLIGFLSIALISITIISFLFYYISSKFNLKYINFYGFFSSMDDASLFMLTNAVLKEITLIYCIIKMSSFSPIYLYLFTIFTFLYSAVSFNILTFIKEAIIGIIEYLIIYFLSLLSLFLVEVKYSKMVVYYIWILSAILISCSIYFFIKNLSYIISKNKYVRRNLIEE